MLTFDELCNMVLDNIKEASAIEHLIEDQAKRKSSAVKQYIQSKPKFFQWPCSWFLYIKSHILVVSLESKVTDKLV